MKFKAKVKLDMFESDFYENRLVNKTPLPDWLEKLMDKNGCVEGYYADGYILGDVHEAEEDYINFEYWIPVYEDTVEMKEVADE